MSAEEKEKLVPSDQSKDLPATSLTSSQEALRRNSSTSRFHVSFFDYKQWNDAIYLWLAPENKHFGLKRVESSIKSLRWTLFINGSHTFPRSVEFGLIV